MSEVDAPDIPHSHAPRRRAHKPKLKKLRFLVILVPLVGLALVSTVFGMMMAVAHDLPSLEQLPETEGSRNSVMVDVRGRELGTLTSNEGRIIAKQQDIGTNVRQAVIAVEDQRFYTNSGVDLRGIGRAFVQDIVSGKAVQGGSTITQQFVKVGLKAQDQRTLFNKLRESALAYHLTRKWSKEKILTEYLNSIYFGNGAYGIEAAARTYFGQDPNHLGCGSPERPCAKELYPQEAALLAAIIASPTAYDPVAHPIAAKRRRDLVLAKMLDQERLTRDQYDRAIGEAIPGASQIRPPVSDSVEPYFTSWIRQSLVDHLGPRLAFEGGLEIRTTVDRDFQVAARAAIDAHVNRFNGPTAALVAIDNDTGEVRAMYGGRDYSISPFNLATQGQRQPGSAFKPFVLAAALREGITPGSIWPSQKRQWSVPGSPGEKFVVNNFDDAYAGRISLANALTSSDNSVFTAVGIKVGTRKVARIARDFGIRTPISTNYAMTLGGLREGVTPLDMAHAYETFATGGFRISGSLGASDHGPVGIRRVTVADTGRVVEENRRIARKVVSRKLATLASNMLTGPVRFGTAKRAQIEGLVIRGKTGTTENNGDAWFVGFTDRYTIAVWVGYPDSLRPMETEFAGDQVTGGTFPALIWRQFMVSVQKIDEARAIARENARLARENAKRLLEGKPPLTSTLTTSTATVPTTTTSTGVTESGGTGVTNSATTPPAPAPASTTPVTDDGTGGVGAVTTTP